jgi:hypothetical protein
MFICPCHSRGAVCTLPCPRTAYCMVTPPEEVLQKPQEELSSGRHVINLVSDGNFGRPELQIRMCSGAKKRDSRPSFYTQVRNTTILNKT